MGDLAGESIGQVLRLDFDRPLMLQFREVASALGAPMSLAWVHESPGPRNWHCQNLSKAALSASIRSSSRGCRLRSFGFVKARVGGVGAANNFRQSGRR